MNEQAIEILKKYLRRVVVMGEAEQREFFWALEQLEKSCKPCRHKAA
jgi:hypothetical protein